MGGMRAWWLLMLAGSSVAFSSAPSEITGDIAPVISLDLSQLKVVDGLEKVKIHKESAAICHKKEEWQTLLYGGEPGWVAKQCDVKNPNGPIKESYAKRCNVLHANVKNCPEPTAKAFDHHNGALEVSVVRKLFVKSDPHQAPEKLDKVIKDISYDQRGEYLILFDAEDASGNQAETVHFAIILQDIIPPKITAPELPRNLQACQNFERYLSLPGLATAVDEYDKDVTDTLTVTVAHNGAVESLSSIDTTQLGEHIVTYAANDYAQIFGLKNRNNEGQLVVKVNVIDTEAPIVFCKTTDKAATCKVESGSLTCDGAAPCAELPPTTVECGAQHQYHDEHGAVCLDFHDSLDLHDDSISTTVIVPSSTILDSSKVSKDVIKYTCVDGAFNEASATRQVHVEDYTPPELNLVDDTELNLVLQLHCGMPDSLQKLSKAVTEQTTPTDIAGGYFAKDNCGTHHCTLELYPGNCGGDFKCQDMQGKWVTCNGGDRKKLPSVTAPFSDGRQIGTFGLKYTCRDGEGLEVSKCRTLVNIDTEICNPPPINCVVSEWAPWSACTRSCGRGTQSRTRDITTSPQYGGASCPELTQSTICNPSECDLSVSSSFTVESLLYGAAVADFDGGMATTFRHMFGYHTNLHWENIAVTFNHSSDCESTDSTSIQVKVVTSSEAETFAGHSLAQQCSTACGLEKSLLADDRWSAAFEKVKATTACTISSRCECTNGADGLLSLLLSEPATETWRDCEVDAWGAWSACTSTCGGGETRRTRSVAVEPRGERGLRCGVLAESKECNAHPCPVHCDWEWSRWSECSVSCAFGTRSRYPRVLTRNQYGGFACPETEYEDCHEAPCPVDCVLESWSGWSWCTHTCGTGSQTRTRAVVVPAEHNGVACASLLEQQSCGKVVCPVDCNVGTWAPYSECSVSCGAGTQTRTRTVGQPRYGGKVCGATSQVEFCTNAPCPINCQVSRWSSWATCPKSCGKSTHSRHRTIVAVPQNGGVGCPPLTESKPCGGAACPVDCGVGSWSSWSDCTVSCGGGSKTRTRKLARPSNGGKLCPVAVSSEHCSQLPCAVDCQVTRWSKWGACSLSCGSGSRTRTRSIARYLYAGGSGCPSLSEIEFCNSHSCPLDCLVGKWHDFTPCTVTCGTGSQTRTRSISPGGHGGVACPHTQEVQECNTDDCPVDCRVFKWTFWSRCTKTCGGGTQVRSRTLTPPEFGGKRCPAAKEKRDCNSNDCPVDCVMSKWTRWTDCSRSCGIGSQSKSRSIVTKPGQGGKDCGPTTEQQSCNDGPCPVHCVVSAWVSWSSCSLSCGSGSQSRSRAITRKDSSGGAVCPFLIEHRDCNEEPCAVDCVVGKWSVWTTCTHTCGSGEQHRTRTNVKPLHGGRLCPRAQEFRDCNTQSCPKDCRVTHWGAWSECSLTCGGGSRTRSRSVSSELEAGGVACPFLVHNESCRTQPCPVDCTVGKWSSYSPCTVTCGTGSQTRTRSISPGGHGGVACPHAQEVQECNTDDCPVDCQVSAWVAWSHCSKSCGGGTQHRSRVLLTPEFGGKVCPASQEIRACNSNDCPVDCVMSKWTVWTECSVTCASGISRKSRTVTTYPENGGVACGSMTASQSCSEGPCPVDCDVTPWSEWSECSLSCGSGSQSRTRAIIRKGDHGGAVCPFLTSTRSCNDEPCPVDCVVGKWSTWNECSLTCGGGLKRRTRDTTQPLHGGAACPTSQDVQRCNTHSCPRDCKVSAWGTWSECTTSCGSGSRTKTRSVTQSGLAGGDACGVLIATMFCNTQPCPVDCTVGKWSSFSPCTVTCGTGSQTRTRSISPGGHGGVACLSAVSVKSCNTDPCAVDCQVSVWNAWSECTHSCSGGTQRRSRAVEHPTFGGKMCPSSRDKRNCNVDYCPVDCEMSRWSAWPDCSKTCGVGQHTRTRSILAKPQYGGMLCPRATLEHRSCNYGPCPVHCDVSAWSKWSMCSRSCGSGSQSRTRSILHQNAHGGAVCPFLSLARSCNDEPCAVDCVVGKWSTWSECSLTCGSGERKRTRSNTKPSNGGRSCPTASEVQACNTHFCPVDCATGDWSEWTHCTVSCGSGSQFRWRSLIHSKHGGIACKAGFESRKCNSKACAVDCLMTTWSEWSICSHSCGDGTQTRRRTVDRRAAFGGKRCAHDYHVNTCNAHLCPVDCVAHEWADWEACSHTCGGGSQKRIRPTTPASHGGAQCTAEISYREFRECNTKHCPVDCRLGPWTAWGDCTRTCVTPDYDNIGEVGTVNVNQAPAEEWQLVHFKSKFVQPVVIIGVPTTNSDEPIVASIKGVTSTGFYVKLHKPACMPKTHIKETMSWMAVEKGSWTLKDGTKIDVGYGSTGMQWTDYKFDVHFDHVPSVLTQIQNAKTLDYYTNIRQNSLHEDGFSGLVQTGVGQTTHGSEMLGWVAIEKGISGAGAPFHMAGTASTGADHATIELAWESVAQMPMIFASVASVNSPVRAAIRTADVTARGAVLTVSPDVCAKKSERVVGEAVSWLATNVGVFSKVPAMPTQRRSRLVYPAQHGGRACSSTETTGVRTCNTHVCPKNCEVGTWTSYSDCSRSCGGGSQIRSRTNAAPTNGGAACPAASQTRPCNTQTCPTDCVVTSWSSWSDCSATCGGGDSIRTRSVKSVAVGGGKACPTSIHLKQCNSAACSVDCRFAAWGQWSECTKSCGGGSHTRTRAVEVHAQHGGAECGSNTQTGDCATQGCAVDCIVSEWSLWTDCSTSCGNGRRSRRRAVLTDSALGGHACPEELSEERTCKMGPCPINCQVAEWGAWSECSVSCNGGSRTRTRKITQKAVRGWICPLLEDVASCNDEACPIDCVVSEWSTWGPCSRSCAGGSKSKTRTVKVLPAHGGAACPEQHERVACNPGPCPIDCVMSPWGPWNPCLQSCGGTHKRYRTMISGAHFGGTDCPAAEDERVCRPVQCPNDCRVSAWAGWSDCSVSCGTGTQTRIRSIVSYKQYGGADCPALVQHQKCNPEHCPQDCSVGRWSEWSECTTSCGEGFATRIRTVVGGLYGGLGCPTSTQHKKCNTQHCPVDCERGPWSAWVKCTKTCGNGTQRRLRNIASTAAFGGRACDAKGVDIRACNDHPCPTDCVVTAWQDWTTCSATCGNGERVSTRDVVRASEYGGKFCPALRKTVACNEVACPLDCEVSAWSDWGACSLSCGNGEQRRSRKILRKPALGGLACPTLADNRLCATHFCPSDCQMSDWSEWSECSRTCGTGIKTRTRDMVQPSDGGAACSSDRDEQPCNTKNCPVDCHQTTWTGYTPCSRSCGSGSQTRTRHTVVAAAFGGKRCMASVSKAACNTHLCPIDCRMSHFESWTGCSVSCGVGTHRRSRHIVTPSRFGGRECSEHSEVESCNSGPCPVGCEVSAWAAWSQCSHTCGGGKRTRKRTIVRRETSGGTVCPFTILEQSCNTMPCAEDCEVSSWSAFSACTNTCGTGSQSRTRTIKSAPVAGGMACPTLHGIRLCYTNSCPVHCEVSVWGPWTACSRSCGSASYRARYRSIDIASLYDGTACPVLKDVQTCTVSACPVDCKMSAYSAWSECSKSCGGGVQSATREVTKSAEKGGNACGATRKTRDCNMWVCPVNCEMSEWNKWSKCSRSCGSGTSIRSRSVVKYPAHGGALCGALSAHKFCNTQHCPVDCLFSEWGMWSTCSSSCEAGTRKRERYLHIPDYFGGKECPHSTEVETCNSQKCPVDCVIGEWQAYGACDASCGTGAKTRLRALTQPRHGGAKCPNGSESAKCNTFSCPLDCEVGAWGAWGACTASCGGGSKTRTRPLTVLPHEGGSVCPTLNQVKACGSDVCPIDCNVGRWGDWTPCTVSCNGGIQTRTRPVLKPQYGGKACPVTQQKQKCNEFRCPVDCVYGAWAMWSRCSVTCGSGKQTRTRSLTAPQHGGFPCLYGTIGHSRGVDHEIETAKCKEQRCPVHCVVSAWGDYGDCSKSCGGGIMSRKRTIVTTSKHGGYTCPGLLGQDPCNSHPCPIDCVPGLWGRWEECSVSCGNGYHSRKRSLKVSPAHGGKRCPPLLEQKFCNDHTCPSDCVLQDWSVWSACSQSCAGGTKTRSRAVSAPASFGGVECGARHSTKACNTGPCPIDCEMNPWTDWSDCTVTCGVGSMTKTRTIRKKSAYGGHACAATHFKHQCDGGACPVDCSVSSWTDWSVCSHSCGTAGTQQRSRVVTRRGNGKGVVCPALRDSVACNQVECPVDCAMSLWTAWTECSHSCGSGWRDRTRFVARKPLWGGRRCTHLSEREACNEHACPVDCIVTKWSKWSSCTATCGEGTQIRHRQVQRAATSGGVACPTVLTASRLCAPPYILSHCPVDCKVGPWGKWGKCSQSCGPGIKRRQRSLVPPQYGGAECPGSSESTDCQLVPCPVHCEHEWLDWTPCSQHCGGGVQQRPVKVLTEPLHGGKACPYEQQRTCATDPCPTPAPTTAPTAAAYVSIVFTFAPMTLDQWYTFEPMFRVVVADKLGVEADAMTITAEAATIDRRRLIEAARSAVKVTLSFEVLSIALLDKIVADISSGAFAASLSEAFGHYCREHHEEAMWAIYCEIPVPVSVEIEVDAKGPTVAPTTAPTLAPTNSPTYFAKPSITVIGGNVITLENTFSGQTYADAGARCSDITDGDLSHKVKTVGTVDLTTVTPRAQIITYSCTNSEGATQHAKRFVFVVSGACPRCELLGDDSMTVEASFPFIDSGISCTDNFPDPQLAYSHKNGVDVEKVGTYRVSYYATDRAGNNNVMCGDPEVIRTVTVVDTLQPVIGLKYHSQTLKAGHTDAPKDPGVDYYAGFMAQQSTSQLSLVSAIGSLGCGVALVALVRLLRTPQSSDSQQPAELTRLI